MAEGKFRAADAPCPSCGGAFVVDQAQEPRRLLDRKRRNAASPFAAARFAEAVQDKAAEHGVIHRCTGCGYRSRFHSATKAA
jgi:predicted RNA-binding Zn-ribbon protein involved in translation (DUF1610 family)